MDKSREEAELFLKNEADKITTKIVSIQEELWKFYGLLNPIQKIDFGHFLGINYPGLGIIHSYRHDSEHEQRSGFAIKIEVLMFVDHHICIHCEYHDYGQICAGILNLLLDLVDSEIVYKKISENLELLLKNYRKDIRSLMFKIQYPEYHEELRELIKNNAGLEEKNYKLSKAVRRAIEGLDSTRGMFRSKTIKKIREDLLYAVCGFHCLGVTV